MGKRLSFHCLDAEGWSVPLLAAPYQCRWEAKVHGRLRVFRLNAPPLTVNDLKSIAEAILTEDQMAAFEKRHELDLGFTSLVSAASESMSTSNEEALLSSCGCYPCASEQWKNSICLLS